jgi:hypothetical protein
MTRMYAGKMYEIPKNRNMYVKYVIPIVNKNVGRLADSMILSAFCNDVFDILLSIIHIEISFILSHVFRFAHCSPRGSLRCYCNS